MKKLKNVWMFSASDMSIAHGPVVHFIELAEALHDFGHTVMAFTPGPNRYPEVVEHEQIYTKRLFSFLPRNFSFQIELLLYFMKKIKLSRPDILYVRHSSYMLLPQILGKILGVQTIVEVNGLSHTHGLILKMSWIKRKIIFLTERISFKLCTHIITVTTGLCEDLIEKYKINKNKVSVVCNGVNTKRYCKKKVSEIDYSIKMALDPEKNIIAYVGSIEKWQGFDLLISLVEQLKNIRTDFVVWIIGDGSFKRNVIEKITNKKINSFFCFWNEQDEKKAVELLSCCTIGILPVHDKRKIFHISPMKLYTYLSMSLPVVAPDIIQGAQILEKHKCGIVVPSGNINEYVKAIDNIFNNKTTCEVMGQKARSVAVEKCDWKIVADKTSLIFQKLFNNKV
ncbi:MAG: glycosyltransferase family 4 protein [Candidatus Theseobacter exili]|nr:glycosyltransferase family 4 protein [Candidatus Theseobacter exili]